MGVSSTTRTYWYIDQESIHILGEAFQRELLDDINNRNVGYGCGLNSAGSGKFQCLLGSHTNESRRSIKGSELLCRLSGYQLLRD